MVFGQSLNNQKKKKKMIIRASANKANIPCSPSSIRAQRQGQIEFSMNINNWITLAKHQIRFSWVLPNIIASSTRLACLKLINEMVTRLLGFSGLRLDPPQNSNVQSVERADCNRFEMSNLAPKWRSFHGRCFCVTIIRDAHNGRSAGKCWASFRKHTTSESTSHPQIQLSYQNMFSKLKWKLNDEHFQWSPPTFIRHWAQRQPISIIKNSLNSTIHAILCPLFSSSLNWNRLH